MPADDIKTPENANECNALQRSLAEMRLHVEAQFSFFIVLPL